MSWILLGLALLWLFDAIRLRQRVQDFQILPDSVEPVSDGHVFVESPGVFVDEATRQAASAHIRGQNLSVLDLVPGDLSVPELFGLLYSVNPRSYQHDPFARGTTAGHTLVVDRSTLNTIESLRPTLMDASDLRKLAVDLKRFSNESMTLAVAPAIKASQLDEEERLHNLEVAFGDLLPIFFGFQMWMFALVVIGLFTGNAWTALALGIYHLQPLIITGGSPFRPRDLAKQIVLRMPLEILTWLQTLFMVLKNEPVQVAELRPKYSESLKQGLESFFGKRAEKCPLCRSKSLGLHLETIDLLQHKPGKFRLDSCQDCGHIFQNPPLSLSGLDYYYRDFYDGLGETSTEFFFSTYDKMYLERAQTLPSSVNPRLWLDVGAGHGHFSKAARKIWPETKFHGLDISESVRLAERRGWLERAYQGLLLDKAENMAGAYDVVSMIHYLEHTQQPRAEIMAANVVLRPEGYLLIEVPDPESAFANLLGKYWVAYLQPQHQHISKLDNLKRILRKSGFEIICVNRENAHNPVDLSCAVYFLLGQIAPPINAPWRSATSWDKRLWRFIVWGGCAPVLALARLLDKVIVPWSRRPGWSNAYRILARKENELGKSAKAELQAQAKMDSGGTKVIRG